mmetsp:Transcript_18560/g.31226  ORF Transcript_18560/g.31226 Transcript_18560/m.31226 type:complete len:212 (-) Transcript_18560:361-996(-)
MSGMDSGFGSAAAAAGLGSLVVGRETTAMWSSSCRLCGYHYAQRLSEHWCSHCLAAAAAAAGEEEGGQHTGSMTLFVFSVPEEAPVRSKMAMSSCKATVIALAAQKHAVTFDKVLEVCSDADTIAQEVEHAIRAEISPLPHPPTAGGGGGGGADIGTAIAGVSSATASIAHRKPQRPGRGRAKVSKFKVEETAEIPAVGTAAGGAAVPADS